VSLDSVIFLHPPKTYVTAKGTQTRQYTRQCDRLPSWYRVILLNMIFKAGEEYHTAKMIQRTREVKTERDVMRLPKNDRIRLYDGKRAWEWFTGEPMPRNKVTGNAKQARPSTWKPGRFTFAQCCEQQGVNPGRLWRRIKVNPRFQQMVEA
jgi:hypothetical protein